MAAALVTLCALVTALHSSYAAAMQAKVECIAPDGRIAPVAIAAADIGDAAASMTNNGTLTSRLVPGETTFIVSYPQIQFLDRLNFVNGDAMAEGELTIAVSNYRLPAASSKWVSAGASIPFSHQRLISASLLGTEARYLKLSFHVQKAGRIATSGLTQSAGLVSSPASHRGAASFAQMTAHRDVTGKANLDFARMASHARVVHVSSGDLEKATQMIDENPATSFRFAATDRHPTVIIELNANKPLNHVTALYQPQPARLDVYLLDDMSKSATDLNYRQPVASVTDAEGTGETVVEFDAAGAKFVALRWVPLETNGWSGAFDVAEITASGNVQIANITEGAPELFARNYDLPTISGEGGMDFSNTLGTVAAPPQIAVLSQ